MTRGPKVNQTIPEIYRHYRRTGRRSHPLAYVLFIASIVFLVLATREMFN